MPINETGHAKNVANFQDLLSFVTGYGATYNPTKPTILLPALNAKHTAAVARLAHVNTALAQHVIAINDRDDLFDPFAKLITRVVNAVQASPVPPAIIDDVRTIARKLQGQRSTPRILDDPNTPEDESLQSISASQMSFDSRIENFHELIQLLAAEPGYNPNEPDLTGASLTALHTSMVASNLTVTTAYTTVSNARLQRDVELYDPAKGLVTAAGDVKTYVKSVYGANSLEYDQINSIQFKRR